MQIQPNKLPPFADVIKGRDVEDPVNLWLHRPLAYGFVALTLRTPLTPNQITVMAMLCGVTAAAFWPVGTPLLVTLGGILLWSSAVLDGADGIMARAKDMHSELGRALDGSADMIVAVCTVFAAFWHIWSLHQDLLQVTFMPVALLTAAAQIWLYDFYKECYQNSTNPAWDGQTTGRPQVEARLAQARAEKAPRISRFAWRAMLDMLGHQHRTLRLTNPGSIREGLRFPVSDETVAIHREHNYWPMQLWALVSLCPHTYLMSICAIFNRLDLYLWYRVLVGNVIWIAAIILQRRATRRTLAELERIGMAPERAEG